MTAFVWAMVWQTALVALAAAALGSVLRGQPAAARHRLFLGALLVAALLPAASILLRVTLPVAGGTGAGSVFVEMAAPVRMAAGSAVSSGGAPFRLPSLSLVLGFLWAAAVMLQAAGLVRRCWRARQAWRRATPERVVAGVPVLRGARGPFTLGWLRPRIVLPAPLLNCEAWASAALAHELAHVRRRDYLWAWLGELALLPLAWHPAARWLAKEAALEREGACDQVALAADSAYPTRLVEIAAALQPGSAPHVGLCLAHRHGFERRIAWLLAPPARRSRARIALAGAGLSVAVVAAWALGGGVRIARATMPVPAAAATAAPELQAAAPQPAAVPSPAHPPQRAAEPVPVPNPAPAPEQAAQPVPVSTNVMQASCISCKAPIYPPEAKAAGLQGTVEMHILIGDDGAVTGINCGVGDPTLLAAAQEAVSGWRYEPLKLDGRPIPISSTVTVTFNLDDEAGLQPIQGLRGVVCDEQGGRIPGALITANALGTPAATQGGRPVLNFYMNGTDSFFGVGASAPAQGTTDTDGAFALDLPSGYYDLRIQARGFQEQERRITLPLDHELLFLLPVGQAQQTVLITGGSQHR